MHPLLEALFNLIFPTRPGCQLCGGPGAEAVCSHCQEWLARWAGQPKCLVCGRPLTGRDRGPKCRECYRQRPPFVLARAAGPYEGPLKQAVHRLKYFGQKSLAPVLAELMLQAIQRQPQMLAAEVVLPVPISPGRLRRRGFNQAELLAREVARGLGLPLLSRVLVKHVETPPQTGLTGVQRRQNLQGSFKVTAPGELKDKKILLLDDVFTTGSTVSVIADLLRQQGAGEIFVITLVNTGNQKSFTKIMPMDANN